MTLVRGMHKQHKRLVCHVPQWGETCEPGTLRALLRGNGGNLRQVKSKTVVAINYHPAIRECFAGFGMEALKLVYAVGGEANRVERRELVIDNWDHRAGPAQACFRKRYSQERGQVDDVRP